MEIEINLKNSQMNNFNPKLNSKLTNSEEFIKNLENEFYLKRNFEFCLKEINLKNHPKTLHWSALIPLLLFYICRNYPGKFR